MNSPQLPDTSTWKPRDTAASSLQDVFMKRCAEAESVIRVRARTERDLSINSFDPGLGIEEAVREEIGKILPSRYSVVVGTINDRFGKTGGDYDFVVFNELWFPRVKAGPHTSSRRAHFPIEGVYAVGEIKQSLGYRTLDSAMEKLIVCHRLHRPLTFARRLIENREATSCRHGLSNPLYSFILATGLEEGVGFEELIDRFFDLNKSVKRLEVVRALAVIGHGTVVWGYPDREWGQYRPALFMLEDLYEPIVPIYLPVTEGRSALFSLLGNLLTHLFHSVLAPEDVPYFYADEGLSRIIKAPKSPEVALQPDKEWLDRLNGT
jgi:hypothetical protein